MLLGECPGTGNCKAAPREIGLTETVLQDFQIMLNVMANNQSVVEQAGDVLHDRSQRFEGTLAAAIVWMLRGKRLIEELSLVIQDGNLPQRRTPLGVNNDKIQAVVLLQSLGFKL